MRLDRFVAGANPSIEKLKGITDLPIGVIGGAPSCPEDFKKLPKERLIVGVNLHVYKLGVVPDFVVFQDGDRDENIKKILKNKTTETLISPKFFNRHLSDYQVDVPHWTTNYSGAFGVWLAGYITTGSVLLCGFDCYQGYNKYFYKDRDTPYASPRPRRLESQLDRWREAFDRIEKPGRIKAMSGPLTQIFK